MRKPPVVHLQHQKPILGVKASFSEAYVNRMPEYGRVAYQMPHTNAAAFDPDDPGKAAYAEMSGTHESWVYPNGHDTQPVSEEHYNKVQHEGYDPDDPWGHFPVTAHPDGGYARGVNHYGKHLLDDPEFQRTGNAPLFYQHDYDPPTLTSLYGTSDGARVTHALLGVMGEHAKKFYGRLPVPSDSLSSDSSKIAKRLQDKGIVEPNEENPNAEVTNALGRDESTESELKNLDAQVRNAVHSLTSSPRLSEEDVLRGQQFMSQALHPAKAPAPAAAEAVDRAEAVASPQAVDEAPEPTLFDRDWNKDG